MLSIDMIQAVMDTSPFIELCGMKATKSDEERQTLEIEMLRKPELERAKDAGQFHGGAIGSLIDTAGTLALAMVLQNGVPTINVRTDFLRPAITESLRAVAMVRKVGRTVGVVDVDVFDASGKLVAVGRGTFGAQGG